MALPLPKVISDVGPGGGIVTAMGGMNALTKSNLDNQMASVKLQYAPMTAYADSASKLAYARLMGPQFLAKLMGNPDVVANSSSLQDPSTTQHLYNAAMGQGTGNSLMQFPQSQNHPVLNWLKNLISGGQQQQQGQMPQGQMPQGQMPQGQMPQGQMPQGQMPQGQPEPEPTQMEDNEKKLATQAWINSPEAKDKAQKEGMYSVPGDAELSSWYQNQQAGANPPASSYADNAGNFAGIKAQREEEGKIRAKQEGVISDENKVEATKLNNLEEMGNLLKDPVYSSIRQLPLANQHEMGWYANLGNEPQKTFAGQFLARSGEIVQQAASQYKGSFKGFENTLINSMKPGPADMPDAARGKLLSLLSISKFTFDRNKLAENLMRTKHMDQSDAFAMADKNLNGPQMRKQLEDQYKPTIKIKNSKGEQKIVSLEEARRLGVPNV